MTIDEAEKIKMVIENKDYVVQLVNSVAKTMVEAFENLKIEDVNMFQLGYNKAIDDFVKYIDDCSGWTQNCIEHDISLTVYTLHQIAEQLKAGGENDKSI